MKDKIEEQVLKKMEWNEHPYSIETENIKEAIELTRKETIAEVEKLIDETLKQRRIQVNECKDEQTIAQLHTFINHFEEELKQKLGELRK